MGGRSGQCYIILGEVGWHNCYITLHGEGGIEKNGIFLLYNMWTAPYIDIRITTDLQRGVVSVAVFRTVKGLRQFVLLILLSFVCICLSPLERNDLMLSVVTRRFSV